ncbi:MAG: prepilin-type N-terminal cleavage/methylation domain-containing protein [Chthoniobacterales bacterium]|nr:prepilin-type N-terminal cleavage/methylation domain-containing protein [Chthoniobacterales bacterium]
MKSASSLRNSAFTLIEMLVAAAILVLLVAVVAQIVNSTSSVTTESRKRLDADGQARTVLDRLAQDFGRMDKRDEADFLFASEVGNDRIFFISEGPGYFSGAAQENQSPLSLVGYRVNTDATLERLGRGLAWSGGGGNNDIAFLTFNPAGQSGSFQPLVGSTIAGNPVSAPGATDADFQVISDAVFRQEFCYQLKDGTFSTKPILNPTGVKNMLTANAAPTTSDGSGSGYAVGSRWYDETARRGYICVDATPGAAVWTARGWKDVNAVVVAVAALDGTSRKLVAELQTAVTALPDATDADLQASPPRLMEETWNGLIRDGAFAQSAGMPSKAANAARVYQRYFYLNTP